MLTIINPDLNGNHLHMWSCNSLLWKMATVDDKSVDLRINNGFCITNCEQLPEAIHILSYIRIYSYAKKADNIPYIMLYPGHILYLNMFF